MEKKVMDIDAGIMNLFEVLKKKTSEVESDEKKLKRSWKTNCSLLIGNRASPVNIQTAKEDVLRKLMSELLMYQDYNRKADIELGLEPSNKFDTYSFDDWKEDMAKRITFLKLADKKKELAKLEDRLNGIVSPEQRRQLELVAISKELGIDVE